MIQSGTPTQLLGGYATLNANAGSISGSVTGDSGIYFNGATTADVQSSTGVYKSGNPWVTVLGPQWIASNGAGTSALNIYGPHWFNDDLSINKAVRIRENIGLTLQAEFLNVTNHPTFSILNGGQNAPQNLNVQSLTFGQATGGPT